MARHRIFGTLPLTAWAVLDPTNRIPGGDERCAIFWTRTTAKRFVAVQRRKGFRIVLVTVAAFHVGPA